MDDDVIAPVTFVEDKKKKNIRSKRNGTKRKKESGIVDRPFIGHRVESEGQFKKQQQLKRQLIDQRFGISSDSNDSNHSNTKNSKKNKNSKNNKSDKASKSTKSGKQQEAKPHINLVVIGHVDAGKSTLMGRLLYEYGAVSSSEMHKMKKQAASSGKGSFAFAWVLDVHGEERERGITVDVSSHYLETAHRCITLLDSPGHKDFIPAMISGAAQADAAILVINAKSGDFETGFHVDNGQTREHALIAKSLGVQQIIVAVNKMDCCQWNKGRFMEIVEQLKAFLKEIGFANKSKKKRNVIFVPVSGLNGTNLVEGKLGDNDDAINKMMANGDGKVWFRFDVNQNALKIDTLINPKIFKNYADSPIHQFSCHFD